MPHIPANSGNAIDSDGSRDCLGRDHGHSCGLGYDSYPDRSLDHVSGRYPDPYNSTGHSRGPEKTSGCPDPNIRCNTSVLHIVDLPRSFRQKEDGPNIHRASGNGFLRAASILQSRGNPDPVYWGKHVQHGAGEAGLWLCQ
jgi:hypothetical protein